jgi:hypothetical protein
VAGYDGDACPEERVSSDGRAAVSWTETVRASY